MALLRRSSPYPHWVSEKLLAEGVPHCFGTRQGGQSQGPFESMNVGLRSRDCGQAVRQNWTRLLEASGLEGRPLGLLRQVHSAKVRPLPEDASFENFEMLYEADGLVCRDPQVAVGVYTADCVPVLVSGRDATGPWVAAIHAGWRGTVDGILLDFLAPRVEQVRALALGPHIRSARFEIRDDVLPRFQAAAARVNCSESECWVRDPDQPEVLRVDLERLLLAQLEFLGLASDLLDRGAPCTFENPEEFFSYRRDGPGRGSLGHVIGVPGGGK